MGAIRAQPPARPHQEPHTQEMQCTAKNRLQRAAPLGAHHAYLHMHINRDEMCMGQVRVRTHAQATAACNASKANAVLPECGVCQQSWRAPPVRVDATDSPTGWRAPPMRVDAKGTVVGTANSSLARATQVWPLLACCMNADPPQPIRDNTCTGVPPPLIIHCCWVGMGSGVPIQSSGVTRVSAACRNFGALPFTKVWLQNVQVCCLRAPNLPLSLAITRLRWTPQCRWAF